MTDAVSKLIPILENLSDSERAEVLGFLIDQMPPDTDDMSDEEFVEELDRRVEEIDNGTAKLIPIEQLWDELERNP